jgi:hypothetical protein
MLEAAAMGVGMTRAVVVGSALLVSAAALFAQACGPNGDGISNAAQPPPPCPTVWPATTTCSQPQICTITDDAGRELGVAVCAPNAIDAGGDVLEYDGWSWVVEYGAPDGFVPTADAHGEAGDGGATDGASDTGSLDATSDAAGDGASDAGSLDAASDTGALDAASDAGSLDATSDAAGDGANDAGSLDAASDAASLDAGSDAGGADAAMEAATGDAGDDGAADAATDAGADAASAD